MQPRIEQIQGRKQLKKFVQFAIDLYKGNSCYVPPLIDDDIDTLDSNVNPSLRFCLSAYFMAYNEAGQCVGRIAGFINPRYNEKSGEKLCRFGFVDFIDDLSVSHALFDAVAQWGRSNGMTALAGPLGMTDLDYEGALTEGYNELSAMVTIYNHAYYIEHFKAYGMEVDAQWIEYMLKVPDEVPEKYLRVAQYVEQHYHLRSFSETTSKRLKDLYGKKIFNLLNVTYSKLYCVSELDDVQTDYYLERYIPMIPLECIRLVTTDNDELVGFAITCPSMSLAQQKARGHIFPFGWIHLLKSLYVKRANDTWDLMLIGVHPDYQGKGVNSLLFRDLIIMAQKRGFKWVQAYPQLIENNRVQDQWKYFEHRIHKRRATFRCSI